MKWNFPHHLLLAIEMSRREFSHRETDERRGDIHKYCLARYIASKCHLTEAEFKATAQTLGVDLSAFYIVGAELRAHQRG